MQDLDSFKALREYIVADYIRAMGGHFSVKGFMKAYIAGIGFKFVVWLRITRYCYLTNKKVMLFIAKRFYKHYGVKFGFELIYTTPMGKGLVIYHMGAITIGAERIGENCSMRPQIVLGNNGYIEGKPTIGDNVSFGVGCKVIGKITIGNNVTIGANAVVTHDVPYNAVVAGIPAKIINWNT